MHSATSQRDRFRTLTFPCRRILTGHLYNHAVPATIGKMERPVLASGHPESQNRCVSTGTVRRSAFFLMSALTRWQQVYLQSNKPVCATETVAPFSQTDGRNRCNRQTTLSCNEIKNNLLLKRKSWMCPPAKPDDALVPPFSAGRARNSHAMFCATQIRQFNPVRITVRVPLPVQRAFVQRTFLTHISEDNSLA
jgi:hypothetical protein